MTNGADTTAANLSCVFGNKTNLKIEPISATSNTFR